jgi:hypothetical protein
MGACCWCEWAYIQEEPDSQALKITFLKKTHLNVKVFENFVMRESCKSYEYKDKKKAGSYDPAPMYPWAA